MAEKKKEEEKPEKAAAGGGKKKLIILAAAGIVLLAAIGAGSYYLGTRTSTSDAAHEEGGAGHAEKAEAAPRGGAKHEKSGPIVAVDEFIINLLDKDANHYLKASIALEVDSELTAKEVAEKMPRVRDAILLLASNKTFAELRDLQGKMQLRAEIAGHLNTVLEKGKVSHIYITNFVIQ